MHTDTADPTAPVFFLSYARAQARSRFSYEPDPFVQRIYHDLTALVNELIPLPIGHEPGFMDAQVDGGERWQDQILRAAGTCQAFVALISPRYVESSTLCAQEWDAFMRRKVARRQGGAAPDSAAIIPVIWTPLNHHRVPPDIQSIQTFEPSDLPGDAFLMDYRTNGLYGLLAMGKMDIYHALVWKLALHIQRLSASLWVEPQIPTDAGRLRTTFWERSDA